MKSAIKNLQKIQIATGALFLAIFFFTVVYQMLARYLGITQMWTEDVSMYSFIWAVFMGAAAMVYEKKHFAFTSLKDNIKDEKTKSILQIVICLVMLFFAVLMLYYGVIIAEKFWNYRWNTIPSLKRGPTWLCLPVCGLTSSIYLVNEIYEECTKIFEGGNK